MSRRQQHIMNYPSSASSPVDTALSLACLSEYAHTLDSLPMDLSRSYGDLRELDAVLSSSMALLTTKINELISMIENKTGTNDERLYLLAEISEEASRLKLGGEDKIRVACHAADGLRSHRTHMRALLDRMPDMTFSRAAEQLGTKTVYPHVTSKHFYPPGMTGEGGRRNRRAAGASASYGGLLLNGAEPSPEKKKRRVQRDDDDDVTRTPSKKERLDGAPPQRQRNGARAKKYVSILPLCAITSRYVWGSGHLLLLPCHLAVCVCVGRLWRSTPDSARRACGGGIMQRPCASLCSISPSHTP